jgi:outer membrane lipoprotein-sorting protein
MEGQKMKTIKKIEMLKSGVLRCTYLLLFMSAPGWSQAPAIDWSLDEAIYQIERQADDFVSAMASIEAVTTDSDGNEISRSTGTGFIREDGRMRFNADGGGQIVLVDSSAVMVFDAEAMKVEEYSLRTHKDRLEPYIRLGFSTTGRDMKDDYLLTILGEETIGDSRTLVIELIPEKDSVRESVRRVKLWINQSSWMPKKQEFSSTKDGTTLTITYFGMARNLKLNPDLFKEDWPREAEKVKM